MSNYTPMQRAQAFLQTGELSDALEALEEHLMDHPDDEDARRMRMAINLRQPQDEPLQAVLSDFEALTTPSPEDFLQASVAAERLEQMDDALEFIGRGLIGAPNQPQLIERQLALLIATDEITDALIIVRQQPKTWQWLEREADLLVMQGDYGTATARYGLALAQLNDFQYAIQPDLLPALRARLLLARANAYRQAGMPAQAHAHYEEARELVGDDPSIRFNLALLSLGQDERAAETLRAAFAEAPESLQYEMRRTLHADETLKKTFADLL